MTGRHLLALLAEPGPDLGKVWPDHQREGDIAAIFTATRLLPRMGRKAAARAAYERQSALEMLMGHGTVLPALPGTVLPPRDAAVMIRANSNRISELSRRLRGQQQYQLRIGYDPEAARLWLPPAAGDIATRMGDLLSEVATRALAPLLTDELELPTVPGLAVNRALMITADRAPALDRALEEIDAVWTEGLSIRLIGPSPAVSFASIGLKRVHVDAIAQAHALLDLSPGAAPPEIEVARRAALMANPTANADITQAATLAMGARAAGGGGFHHLFTWSEGQAAPQPMPDRDVA